MSPLACTFMQDNAVTLLLELMTLSLFYHNSAQRTRLQIVRGTETASLY